MTGDRAKPVYPSYISVAGLQKRRGRFDADAVEELIARVRESYKILWDERAALRKEIERLTAEAAQTHEPELRAELRHGYRSFLLAALELAEREADGAETTAPSTTF